MGQQCGADYHDVLARYFDPRGGLSKIGVVRERLGNYTVKPGIVERFQPIVAHSAALNSLVPCWGGMEVAGRALCTNSPCGIGATREHPASAASTPTASLAGRFRRTGSARRRTWQCSGCIRMESGRASSSTMRPNTDPAHSGEASTMHIDGGCTLGTDGEF